MQNHLKNQTSPYLLQHVNNPVDWYPWCNEAFERAKAEDKPIFLSIGYSTCHWCHVMAHESFEDAQVAEFLNKHFISIKVDREERPDINHIYMTVCQAFTGSGGWPTTLFLTPEQKPFFAGTYFPKNAKYGQIGLVELLQIVQEKWETDREVLLKTAEEIVSALKKQSVKAGTVETRLIDEAVGLFKHSFDPMYGGFGDAPKFPTPHNLLFLMQYYEKHKDKDVMQMVDKTLLQMYLGGLFYITGETRYEKLAEQQLGFMSKEAEHYPAGYSMFLVALSEYLEMPEKIKIVVKDRQDLHGVSCKISLSTVVDVLPEPTKEYPLKEDKTTFYVCRENSCLPPVN